MKKIKMKVVDYDVESNSIIVAFSSDCAKKTIDEYPSCAYQPTMFDDPTDSAKVLEEIARAGIFVAEEQDKQDKFKEEDVLDKVYAGLVGQEFEYDVEALIESANQVVEVENESTYSDIDELLQDIEDADDEIDLSFDDDATT